MARNPKIKVLRIVTRLNVGGPALQIASHAHRLPSEEFEQVVVHGEPDRAEGSLAGLLDGSPSRIVAVPDLIRPVRPTRDLRALRALERLLREERPDIVHTHLFKAGALGRTAARKSGVPHCVHTFHGTIFQGHFGPMRSRIALAVERRLAVRSQLVALSPSQRDHLREKGVGGDNLHVIPSGFDLSRFHDAATHRDEIRKELDTPAEAPVIALVGRLAPVKNVSGFLELVPPIATHVPGCRIWIAGDGPERSRLEAQSRRLGLDPVVRFLGFRDDTHRILGGADLLVVPSRSEGLPVTVLEAMSAGCPVVATPVGGLVDLIDSGVTGILASTEELVPALLDLLRSPEKRTMISTAARDAMRGRYTVDAMIEAHRELYRELSRKG